MPEHLIFQLPSLWLIVGATGDGKTFLMNKIVRMLDSGSYEARYPTDHPNELFQRVLYICAYGGIHKTSADTTHVSNLEEMQKLKVPVEVIEYGAYEKNSGDDDDHPEGEEITQEDYEEIMKRRDPARVFGRLLLDVARKMRSGDLIIFDDVQHFFDALSQGSRMQFQDLILKDIHHRFISVMILLQRSPAHNFLGMLTAQANYIIYMTRRGFNWQEIGRLFRDTRGKMTDIVKKLKEFGGNEGGEKSIIFDGAEVDESATAKKVSPAKRVKKNPGSGDNDAHTAKTMPFPDFILFNKQHLFFPEAFGLESTPQEKAEALK